MENSTILVKGPRFDSKTLRALLDKDSGIFLQAIAEGNLEQVKRCVKVKPNVLDKKKCADQCPLYCAVYNRHIDIVAFLVEKYVSQVRPDELIDCKDHPVFFVACNNNDIPMMEYLASQKQIDINGYGVEESWPFNNEQLDHETKEKIYELFHARHEICTAYYKQVQIYLNTAALYKRKELVDRALALGADINGKNFRGMPALNDVWFYNQTNVSSCFSIMKHLIDKGADIQNVVERGTIFHRACVSVNNDLIVFLLDNGAVINDCSGNSKRTGLHWLFVNYASKKSPNINAFLATSFLLMCSNANPRLIDKRKKSVASWRSWAPQAFSSEEGALFDAIISMTGDKKNRLNVLKRICAFQYGQLELIKIAQQSSGAKIASVQNALVAIKYPLSVNVSSYDDDYLFKDIYQKFVM